MNCKQGEKMTERNVNVSEDEVKTSAKSPEKPQTSGVVGTWCNGKTNQDDGNEKKRETHGKGWVTKKEEGQKSLPNEKERVKRDYHQKKGEKDQKC